MINQINITNRINKRLINPCKLGHGLIRINMDQYRLIAENMVPINPY